MPIVQYGAKAIYGDKKLDAASLIEKLKEMINRVASKASS